MEETVQATTDQTTGQTTKHPFWQHFSKRTLVLICILTFITLGLVYVAIREEQPSSQAVMPTPTPVISHAFSTLSLVPLTVSSSTYQTVAIHIESNQNKTSGVQINLAYDPQVLSNVSLKIGNYLTNPAVLLNTIDPKNGRITLVLGLQPNVQQASGSGTIATVSYSILPTAQKTTTISFLPKTAVTQDGELESVLKNTQNLTIQIPQTSETKVPATSPSAK